MPEPAFSFRAGMPCSPLVVGVDLLRSAPVEFGHTHHQFVADRPLQVVPVACPALQRHTVEHNARRHAMRGGEQARHHIGLQLPGHRVGRRYVLHGELDRADQFGPCVIQSADMRREQIVEHARTGAVPGQAHAEHGSAGASAVAITVNASIPWSFNHGFTV